MEYMIGMRKSQLAEQQQERILLAWDAVFMMDDSGRSTGKSHNLLAVDACKLPLLPDRAGLLLGMDKEIGSELFDEHIGQWLVGDGHLKDFVDLRRTDMEGRIPKTTYGRKVEFLNAARIPGLSPRGSRFMTMTPDLSQNGKKMQSWRFNMLHFNEWTSWPKPDIMAETIEPIATRTNYWHKNTVRFRIAMETHMQIPLGKLTDSQMAIAYALDPSINLRSHIDGSEPQPGPEIVRRFMINFRKVYGFDYNQGVQYSNLQLSPIKTPSDVEAFFSNFLDGDPALQNQLVYDGSAKKPSDACYEFKQFFDEQESGGHPLYKTYNMSVEDLDPKWDGIIYNSAVIKKYKESHLDEDYQRVYGGKWVEGYRNKPYDPVEITNCMHDIRPHMNREPDETYIVTVDSAKGTERMRAEGGARTDGLGQGDDAGAAILRLGDGTSDKPDLLQWVYLADDVRKDPMAWDIHQITQVFTPIILGLDPGGGGGDLADSLAKRTLVLPSGELVHPTPIVPFDWELDISDEVPILHFVSRGNKMVKAVYIQADSQKDTWRTDDFLVNKIHEVARLAFAKQTVAIPRLYPKVELLQLYNAGAITLADMEAMSNMNRAINQIKAINYLTDSSSGRRIKTKNGLNRYTSPRRKDLAYCVLYALFFAHTLREFQGLVPEDSGVPMVVG